MMRRNPGSNGSSAAATTRWRVPTLLLTAGLLAAVASPQASGSQPSRLGVLVMAHGGDVAWNAAVQDAVVPVAAEMPTEVAFGMAERAPLQRALERLEAAGATRVVVVRLFISPASFLAQTEYLLGLASDAPPFFMGHEGAHPPRPVATTVEIALSRDGLMDAAAVGRILKERVAALSTAPEHESVLLLAHGMGTPEANTALRAAMEERADTVRRAAPYRLVAVETLREDWEADRAIAEPRIRAFAQEASQHGSLIVVPFRLAGFGPYAEVLAGIDYVADRQGLLPHPEITRWIRDTAIGTACAAGWNPAPARCGTGG